MCMFSSEPEVVSSTNIFVGETIDNKQVTVYSNTVKTKLGHHTAMILPYPTINDEECVVLDMSKSRNFFDVLKNYIPEREPSRSLSRGSCNPLKIFQSGGYKCSIARNFEDLNRLQASEFGIENENGSKSSDISISSNNSNSSNAHSSNDQQLGLPQHLTNMLRKNYASGFGFLICKIDDDAEFAPIAYTHNLENDLLFIPTRHDHGNVLDENIDNVPDWDHTIYICSNRIRDLSSTSGHDNLFMRLQGKRYRDVYNLNKLIEYLPRLPFQLKNVDFKNTLHRFDKRGAGKNFDICVPCVKDINFRTIE